MDHMIGFGLRALEPHIAVSVKLSAKIICYESIDTRDSAFLITKEMTYLYALVMFRICLGFKFADLTSVF